MAAITLETALNLRLVDSFRQGWITQVAFSPDGRTLGVSDGAGVSLYPLRGTDLVPDRVQRLPHPAPVKGFAFHPTRPIIATACADTVVRVWSGAAQPQMLIGHTSAVNGVAFEPDNGERLVSCSMEIRVWDWTQAKPQQTFHQHQDEIDSVAWSRNWIASAGRDQQVWLNKPDDSDTAISILHQDWVRDVVFSPDGTLLASASKDGTLRIQPPDSTGAAWQAHPGGVDCAAFSADGQLLFSGGRDGMIRVWKADSRHSVVTLSGHEKPVLSLTLNPQNTLLVSGGGDNRVILWRC